MELLNRPVNNFGLSGLLFTTAPHTASPGTIEISTAILYENSAEPVYSLTEYPVSITAGIGGNKELAIRGSLMSVKQGPAAATIIDRKAGDMQLSYKWNFMPQPEDSAVPGVAFIMTGMAPTEKNADEDVKVNPAAHWGLTMGLATGAEIAWKDHVLALYADARLGGQDLTEERLRDIYGLFNAGMLFPISKYRNLQMFFEYSALNGMDTITVSGGDYTAITYGLRLVSEDFNLTMATQFRRKKQKEFDNAERLVALMSFKF